MSTAMAFDPVRAADAATRFISFVDASPTPFHAVHNAVRRLENAGFRKVNEKDDWEGKVAPGGKYYFTRNQSSLLAFIIPQNWTPGGGVSIVATHVDSPNLRVRPVSKRTKAGYIQVAVETYGGGIWHSWLDRDLSIAGRITVLDKSSGRLVSRLVKVERPLLRIPSLAIHLDRNVNDVLKFNQETEFVPILSQIAAQFNPPTTDSDSDDSPSETPARASSDTTNHHHPGLLSVIAEELSIAPEDIHDLELALYDTQPSTLGGLNNEFIFSPRLDNLVSSFCAVEALADSVTTQSPPTLEGNVNCIALFNHEEVGSVSTTGAQSSLIPSLLERLSPTPAGYHQSIARSFILSADMGHAVHPNYTSKHQENHKPVMNGGIAIKTNAKQRYATDAVGAGLVKRLVHRKGGKVQEFEVRNDMPCGSTVGPLLSKLGIRTVDVGNPMLSMHSIRETAGAHDVQHAIDLFSSLFEGFAELDRALTVD